MSPILANIYLNELDSFMEEYKQRFDVGDYRTRKATSAYRSQQYQVRKARASLKLERNLQSIAAFKGEQRKLLATSYYPAIDPSFVKIQYSRYADDFIIGVIGSKDDAERVKADVRDLLQSKLKLTLSDEKTKVTHSSDFIRFLGYDITVSRDKGVMRDKKGVLRRVWYGNVKLYIPHEKWAGKLLEYQALRIVKSETGKELWKPRTRGKLVNRTKIEIISKYNAEIRGLYNFYRLANNVSVLNKFAFIMEGSMLKTFAAKGHSTAKQMRLKHTREGILGVDYENRAGMRRCEFYHDGFTRKNEAMPDLVDLLPQYRKYDKPNSLANRLKAGSCELCGGQTDDLRIHHVRALKALTGKTVGELLMMQRRRKSLALCPVCFETE